MLHTTLFYYYYYYYYYCCFLQHGDYLNVLENLLACRQGLYHAVLVQYLFGILGCVFHFLVLQSITYLFMVCPHSLSMHSAVWKILYGCIISFNILWHCNPQPSLFKLRFSDLQCGLYILKVLRMNMMFLGALLALIHAHIPIPILIALFGSLK